MTAHKIRNAAILKCIVLKQEWQIISKTHHKWLEIQVALFCLDFFNGRSLDSVHSCFKVGGEGG